jgi:hypothetical protein
MDSTNIIWSALKLIRVEYLDSQLRSVPSFDAYEFEEYIEDRYGIEIRIGRRGYKIVDETKYTYFLLKFT